MKDFRIRWAASGDGHIIHGLINALAVYERAPEAVKNTPARLDAQLGSPHPPFECLLAQAEDDTPLGFALFFHTYSTWEGERGIHLEDLFVVPEARRAGVAGALLARLAELTVNRGCARLEWSVLRWNQMALDFYASLHAETLGDWQNQRLSGAALQRLAIRSKTEP